ncbi:hypothetical protein ACFVJ8_04040 [Streptomyces yangpuensis]|uniref:hypothetical protein n=1 Tax=Streptomyces yangpuensis TaxID=1648182 RepID=UPI00363FAA10
MLNMPLRSAGNHQPGGDLPVCQTLGQKLDDFTFPQRQSDGYRRRVRKVTMLRTPAGRACQDLVDVQRGTRTTQHGEPGLTVAGADQLLACGAMMKQTPSPGRVTPTSCRALYVAPSHSATSDGLRA